jgi:LemA protein
MIIYIYNKLIVLSKRTEEAFSDIDVQLKRRHDLIPNLVETVKAYAKHEKELFENVARLRSQAISAHSLSEKSEAENLLSQALKSIFALVENYPDLKASQNFQELQRELADTEDKIQAARRFYNSCVLDLNTNIEVFPQNIIARLFNISKREFFEIKEEKEREPVKVDFD